MSQTPVNEEFSFGDVSLEEEEDVNLAPEQEEATPEEDGPSEDEQTPSNEAPKPEASAPQLQTAHDEVVLSLVRQLEQNNRQASQPAPQEPPSEKYALNLNEDIVAQMSSEDPAERRQGMNIFASSLANMVYKDAIAEVRSLIESEYGPQLISYVEQKQQADAMRQKIDQEFYSKYPALNTDAGRQLASRVFVQIAQDAASKGQPIKEWTPALGDKIAQGVQTLIASISGKPAAKPSFKPKPGARPAEAKVNDPQSEIMNVVTAF